MTLPRSPQSLFSECFFFQRFLRERKPSQFSHPADRAFEFFSRSNKTSMLGFPNYGSISNISLSLNECIRRGKQFKAGILFRKCACHFLRPDSVVSSRQPIQKVPVSNDLGAFNEDDRINHPCFSEKSH
jgi:hypothetical protein